MAYLTDDTVSHLAGAVTSRDRFIQKVKEKAKKAEHHARSIASVCTGSLAFNYLDAAYSADGHEWTVFNVPISVLAGAALHALAWSGYAGKHADLASGLGTGALTAFTGHWGRKMGHSSRSKPARHGVHGVSGPHPYATGALPQPGQRYQVDGVHAYAGYGG